jgi:hypothetical protein
MSDFIAVFIAVISIFVYFLPAFIAHGSAKYTAKLISLINLLIGWTVIGWFIVLFWALSPDTERYDSR